jgi:hypothetical protein
MTAYIWKQIGISTMGMIAAFAAIGAEHYSTADSDYTLSLQFEGASPSSSDEYRRLHDLAVSIVRSSNDSSRHPLWNWDLAEILGTYRRAVDGRYLVVTYATPRSIKTVGGELVVKEILIGLNGSQYASSLHTVDDEGRIVGHAKYSGELCIEMLQLVRSFMVGTVETTPDG